MKISKITLLLFLFLNSLNADYLLTVTKTSKKNKLISKCIKEYFTNDKFLVYRNSKNDRFYEISNKIIATYSVQSGFWLDEYGYCSKVSKKLSQFKLKTNQPMNADNLSYLGLSDSDLNMMFAFSGLLISSLFLFGLFRFI